MVKWAARIYVYVVCIREEFYRRVLNRFSWYARILAYAYVYSSNLHPQSGSFDRNTIDVRAGESLTRLLVEISQVRVRHWRGSEKLAGIRLTIFRESHFSRSSWNGIYFDWTSSIHILREILQVRDLAYRFCYSALLNSLLLGIGDASKNKGKKWYYQ